MALDDSLQCSLPRHGQGCTAFLDLNPVAVVVQSHPDVEHAEALRQRSLRAVDVARVPNKVTHRLPLRVRLTKQLVYRLLAVPELLDENPSQDLDAQEVERVQVPVAGRCTALVLVERVGHVEGCLVRSGHVELQFERAS